MSEMVEKQTVSLCEIGMPDAHLYPCTEEFRSVCGSFRTTDVQHRAMQGQLALPIVHVVKVEADIPKGFLSG